MHAVFRTKKEKRRIFLERMRGFEFWRPPPENETRFEFPEASVVHQPPLRRVLR